MFIYKSTNNFLTPNCGKSKKEIEKALAKGKEPSNEEIVKRLREAGLDPTKLK